ncbi:MAG: polymer-forming cytoskeletal protein [Candidatus Magasanikbacteria bacterium]|jgi:cytoskeletal protein CcmA (bactofilin family)
MIFQKSSPKQYEEEQILAPVSPNTSQDNVETIVGPSVNVEGDFASEGNIIVKGSVAGSVHTSRHLVVEMGARIMANVRAGSAQIAGEVRGNMKIKESLELQSTARVLGDIEAKTLVIEAGALLLGKVTMPGLEENKPKTTRGFSKKSEEIAVMAE